MLQILVVVGLMLQIHVGEVDAADTSGGERCSCPHPTNPTPKLPPPPWRFKPPHRPEHPLANMGQCPRGEPLVGTAGVRKKAGAEAEPEKKQLR